MVVMLCKSLFFFRGVFMADTIVSSIYDVNERELFASNQNLVEEIRGVIQSTLKLPTEKVHMDAHFVSDLECDSLDIAEIVMELESKYSITVEDKVLEKIQRVRDAIRVTMVLVTKKV